MDADGLASEDLGLLFGYVSLQDCRNDFNHSQINDRSTNATLAAFWTTFEVFARPHLLSRVRDTARSAYETRSESSESLRLGNNPLLQSIFAETTRVRVVGMMSRERVHGDFQLGEWSIPQGSVIAIPSLIGGTNKDVWNAGTKEEPHSMDEFWEKRFLVYPDKPDSGPLRQKSGTLNRSQPNSLRLQKSHWASQLSP